MLNICRNSISRPMNVPSTPAPEKKWLYANAENQPIGPLSVTELRQLAASGIINLSTFVIEEGGAEWKTYGAIATPPVPTVPPPSMEEPRRWPAMVGVLLCFPIGLIALWLSKGYSRAQKWIMAGISLPVFAAGLALGRPGFIFLVIISNGLLFIWWGEKLGTLWKVALSVVLCLFFLPPALMKNIPGNPADRDPADGFTSPVSQRPSNAAMPPPSREEKAPRAIFQLKEDFRLGNFTYRILGANRQVELGGGFSHIEASPGAIFLLVNYKITNESNKTATVMSDDLVLKDAKGREFRPSSKAVTAMAMSEPDRDFILSELQPGLTKQTTTAFEVPVSALQGEIVLVIPEKGWGAGKAEVLLKK
jgi:hypothetical protein